MKRKTFMQNFPKLCSVYNVFFCVVFRVQKRLTTEARAEMCVCIWNVAWSCEPSPAATVSCRSFASCWRKLARRSYKFASKESLRALKFLFNNFNVINSFTLKKHLVFLNNFYARKFLKVLVKCRGNFPISMRRYERVNWMLSLIYSSLTRAGRLNERPLPSIVTMSLTIQSNLFVSSLYKLVYGWL